MRTKEFLREIDLHSRGLETALAQHLAGEENAAAETCAEVLRRRLAALPEQRLRRDREQADDLLQNRITLLGAPAEFAGDPIDWIHFAGDDRQWQSHLGYLYFPEYLLTAWEETGDEKYLTKWKSIHREFLKNHPADTEKLFWSTRLPMYEGEYLPITGGEGFCPDYIGGSWISLACASRTATWIREMAFLARNGQLDTETLIELTLSLMGDHRRIMLSAPRKGTPNQFFSVAKSLVQLSVIFWEFYEAPGAYLVGMQRLEEQIGKCVLPDGTDLEQSMNYNVGFAREFHALCKDLGLRDNRRIARMREKAVARCEYLAFTADPEGKIPDVAKTHHTDVLPTLRQLAEMYPESETLARVVRALEKGEDDPALPRWKDFPYGGYSVLHPGYGRRDGYLFFKYSRWSPGHKHEDANSVVISAFGRELLVDTGNFNYASDPASERLHHFYFSSWGHNTCDLDGLSQRRLAMEGKLKVDERWPEKADNEEEYAKLQEILDLHKVPCPGVRYHGKKIDVLQGVYADGWQAKDGEKGFTGPVTGGSHTRTILSLHCGAYVFLDTLLPADGKEHLFSQHWHLSHTYRREEIRLTDTTLTTCAGEGANLLLQTFCAGDQRGVLHWEERDPLRGWRATEYNEMQPAGDAEFLWKGKTGRAVTLLLPCPGGVTDPGAEWDGAELVWKAGALRLRVTEDGFEAEYGRTRVSLRGNAVTEE